MPIKGISDRRRRLIRVGKLHLGVKAKTAKNVEYPKAVDYFVCKEDASTSAEAVAAFKEVYGDKPKELDIVFPTDDELLFADQNYKMYSRSWGLLCRGDGEEATAKWDLAQDGTRPSVLVDGIGGGTWANSKTESWVYRKIPCMAAECPMQIEALCKAVMNLQFMLPRVKGIGIWQIDTGSWNSIHAVLDSIETVKAVTGERIRGVPLVLSLVPKEVTPMNTKTKTVHVLQVALPSMTLPEMLAQTAKLPERALLPAPVDEEEVPGDLFRGVDEETGEVIEGEVVDEGPQLPYPSLPIEAGQAFGEPTPESPESPPAAPEPPSEDAPLSPGKSGIILTLGELLNLCLAEFKVDKAGVLNILGVADVKEIMDYGAAYRAVKAAAKE